MSDLTVLVPSRGRPDNVRRLVQAWKDTGADARLIFGFDDDDDPGVELPYPALPDWLNIYVGPRLRLGGTLNAMAEAVETKYVGFMGDDHCVEQGRWDQIICEALAATPAGMVYGDDGIQHQALPTAIFMTTNIPRTLGYMVPPGLTHLFIDSAWLALGRAANCITYLPHVKIGHHHPIAGLAEWDDGYRECNSGEQWDHDEKAYHAWEQDQLATDAAKIRQLNDSGPR